MYSFTNVKVIVGRSTAGCDMQCAYCFDGKDLLGIKANQDYFFIEGNRTYERIGRVDNVSWLLPTQTFVPYVPKEFKKELGRNIREEEFREKIKQHRMCMGCYNKLSRFFSHTLVFPKSTQEKIEVITRHTMRKYMSMPNRSYICKCCNADIAGNTLYGRKGINGTVCISCLDLLAPFIGKEFSY